MSIPCIRPAGAKPGRLVWLLAVIAWMAVAAPAVAEDTCVEVEIGGEKPPSLSCINSRLRKQAGSVVSGGTVAPSDAASPPASLGGYNESALKQQYGPNFGKSAIPSRPTPTYGTTPR